MKKLFLAFWLIAILAYSCDDKTIAYFEITNNSSAIIESLSISGSGYDNNNSISIELEEKKEYLLDMTDYTADGEYLLKFKFESDTFNTKSFGYYTNGFPLESLTRISIQDDTLIIDSEPGKVY